MKIVHIVCAENKSWIYQIGVWGIEKIEGTDFDHVSIVLYDNYDGNWVYESVFPTSRKIRMADWLKKFKVIKAYKLELTEDQYVIFLEEMLAQLEKPYSLLQCVLIAFYNILGIVNKALNKLKYNGEKSLICSEFIARPIVAATGYEFDKSLDLVGMDEMEECLNKIGVLYDFSLRDM